MGRLTMLLGLGFVLVLSGLSCKDSNNEKLEALVAGQSTQIAQLEEKAQSRSSAIVTATTFSSTPSSPEPSSTLLATNYDRILSGQIRYIAYTDGAGVRIRSTCENNASGLGVLPEGTGVTVNYGQSNCPDWLQVQRGEISSWVRVNYLSITPPEPTKIPPTANTVPKTSTPSSANIPTPVNTPVSQNAPYGRPVTAGTTFPPPDASGSVPNASPKAPTDLQVIDSSSVDDPSSIRPLTLSWVDNSMNEDGFEIEYQVDAPDFSPLYRYAGTNVRLCTLEVPKFVRIGWWIRVRALNSVGYSPWTERQLFMPTR